MGSEVKRGKVKGSGERIEKINNGGDGPDRTADLGVMSASL